MGLPDVVDAINADFIASSVPCTIKYGPDHLAEHDMPYRIVIWPTSDSYGPPNYVQQNAWPSGDTADGQNPRPVATRNEGGKAVLWAAASAQVDPTTQQRADYDALHNLINQFVLSLHRVNPGNYKVNGGKTVETTRVDRLGYVYELEFSIECPIIDAAWPTETGVSQSSTIQELNPDLTVMAQVTI